MKKKLLPSYDEKKGDMPYLKVVIAEDLGPKEKKGQPGPNTKAGQLRDCRRSGTGAHWPDGEREKISVETRVKLAQLRSRKWTVSNSKQALCSLKFKQDKRIPRV